ncbi:MAG: hypothetical protein ACMXX9_01050 [Candidatus Woesearchaeota archaeon]
MIKKTILILIALLLVTMPISAQGLEIVTYGFLDSQPQETIEVSGINYEELRLVSSIASTSQQTGEVVVYQGSLLEIRTYGGFDQQMLDQQIQNQQFDVVSTQQVVSAQDYSNQFFVGGFEANINTCSCQALTDRVLITNTADFRTVFSLSSNLDVVSPPTQVVLEPKESKIVDIPISIPCNQRSRTNTYELIVASNLGGEQVLTRSLTTNKCESIQVDLYSQNEEILPGESNLYQIMLTNPAPFTEEYVININSLNNYFEDQSFRLELSPGQTGVVNTTLNTPIYLYGVQQVEFEVLSLRNNLRAEINHELNINWNYDFELSSNNKSSCMFTQTTVPIVIKNNAHISNDYTISVVRGRGSLSTNNLSLQRDEAASIDLYTYSQRQRKEEFVIRVESLYGDLVKDVTFTVDFDNCYDLELNLNIDDFKNICSGNQTYDFTIKNIGSKELTADLDLEFLGQKQYFQVTLNPNEETTVPFRLQIPEQENVQTLSVLLNANLQEADLEYTDKKRLVVYNNEMCTKINLNNQRPQTRYFEEDFTLTFIQRGIQTASYTIFYDGSDKFSLNTTNFSLAPNEQKQVLVTTNLSEQDIGRHHFKITLVSENQNYEFNVVVNVRDYPLHQRLYWFVTNYTCFSVSILLVIIFISIIILFIIGLLAGYVLGSPGIFRVSLLVLIPLILLLTIILYGVPQSLSTPTGDVGESLPHIRMFENSVLELDLDNYFIDPDGSELSYRTGFRPQIEYTITNNILTLRSQEALNSSFTIIASDGIDETESPTFRLEVIPRESITLRTYYDVYCQQFNALFLILILLLIYLTPLKAKKKKK